MAEVQQGSSVVNAAVKVQEPNSASKPARGAWIFSEGALALPVNCLRLAQDE